MVSPFASYFACQSRNCGITFLQLYQPYVQNSTKTTRPRSLASERGSLLIQRSPVISGAGWPIFKLAAALSPAAEQRGRDHERGPRSSASPA